MAVSLFYAALCFFENILHCLAIVRHDYPLGPPPLRNIYETSRSVLTLLSPRCQEVGQIFYAQGVDKQYHKAYILEVMAKIEHNDLTRLTAYVPSTMMAAVKLAAARRGITVSKLVQESLTKDRYLWSFVSTPTITLRNKNKNGKRRS